MKPVKPESPFAKAISATFDSLTGFVTADDFLKQAKSRLGLYEIEDAVKAGLEGEYQRQKGLRSIEKMERDQGQLFTADLLDKLISYITPEGEHGTVKVRFSTFAHQTQFREKQILNVRKATRSFDRWEERREPIMPLMASDPEMTVERALIAIGKHPDQIDKAA